MTTAPASVIFDLDGTLVDTAPLCAAIINEMLCERGSSKVVDESSARAFLTNGGAQLISGLLGSDGGQIGADLARFRTLYSARRTPSDSLYPGVGKGLRALTERGVQLAICSNKPQSLCDSIVSDLALSDHCPIVVGSLAGVPLKPAPDLALIALAKLGAASEDCLYVGDSEVDRQTAASVGIPFLFVTYGYAEPGAPINALARFDHFDQVVHFVLQRQEPSFARRQIAR